MFNKQSHPQRGAAMLLFVIFFVVGASSLAYLFSRSIYSDLAIMNSLIASKHAYLTAESGLEDVLYRTMEASYPVSSTEVLTTLTGIATTTQSYDASSDSYYIQSTAQSGKSKRSGVVLLTIAGGTAFNYGIQSGNGGFQLTNSATINGNVFSNGSIVGAGSSQINGDVISAGTSGLISKVRATGTAWANTLNNSYIEKDAHYNVVGTPSTVLGTRYTPATMPATATMPITDTKVDEWKTTITNTGTVIPASACTAGTYLIDTTRTIGNVKIECNLEIRNTGGAVVVTLSGPVWVTGNIDITQGPEIRAASSLGRRSVQMIADNPSNRLTSSKITIRNSTKFYGSGNSYSYVMMLSQNNSAELGGSEVAIDVSQQTTGDYVLYAGHGLVNIGNNIDLRSTTGYIIAIANNSSVTYETGLASALFTGGPGGGYTIARWYQQ